MTVSERKALQAKWRKLASVVGPGRKPELGELERRYREVMAAVREGRDPYPPCER